MERGEGHGEAERFIWDCRHRFRACEWVHRRGCKPLKCHLDGVEEYGRMMMDYKID